MVVSLVTKDTIFVGGTGEPTDFQFLWPKILSQLLGKLPHFKLFKPPGYWSTPAAPTWLKRRSSEYWANNSSTCGWASWELPTFSPALRNILLRNNPVTLRDTWIFRERNKCETLRPRKSSGSQHPAASGSITKHMCLGSEHVIIEWYHSLCIII